MVVSLALPCCHACPTRPCQISTPMDTHKLPGDEQQDYMHAHACILNCDTELPQPTGGRLISRLVRRMACISHGPTFCSLYCRLSALSTSQPKSCRRAGVRLELHPTIQQHLTRSPNPGTTEDLECECLPCALTTKSRVCSNVTACLSVISSSITTIVS